jgi:hypothetical protein
VVATFSELLDPATITSNNFTLVQQSNGQPVAGTAIYNGTTQTVTFTPAAYLTANTTYLATVKGARLE